VWNGISQPASDRENQLQNRARGPAERLIDMDSVCATNQGYKQNPILWGRARLCKAVVRNAGMDCSRQASANDVRPQCPRPALEYPGIQREQCIRRCRNKTLSHDFAVTLSFIHSSLCPTFSPQAADNRKGGCRGLPIIRLDPCNRVAVQHGADRKARSILSDKSNAPPVTMQPREIEHCSRTRNSAALMLARES